MSARYAPQQALPQIGAAGQARLSAAHVCVVGAGGLGCALLPYLAAAGVGRLSIVDHDRIEESNLHRQVLYGPQDVGQPKAQAACAQLRKLNPDIGIEGHVQRVTPANAAAYVAAADVMVDAADSLALTYTLSDACRAAGRPLVSASVLGLSGYAGAFCGGAPSYRAVFPDMPRTAAGCTASGVLGSAVGVIGTLQAHLTLALLLGLEPSPLGQLLSVDFRTLHFGGFAFLSAREPEAPLRFIVPAEVNAADLVIDLRSVSEAPRSPFPQALRTDVESLERAPPPLDPQRRIVLCCRSGVRAWRGARALERRGLTRLALVALYE